MKGVKVEADEIGMLGPELKRFMRKFAGCFGRREPAEHAALYVRGQLSNLPRKSVEPMAEEAGVDPRALQKFLAQHLWDDARMVRRTHEIVAHDHADPLLSIGVIDETSFAKKGTKTPGVQRQHCGATGKTDNCTVTVHLGYAAADFHCLLSSALFLPESWSADRERCREAGIPDALVHRPKWQIALELHQQAIEQGMVLAWVTADEAYGRPVEFHLELTRRRQPYVVEVPVNFYAWGRLPKVVRGKRGPRVGSSAHISTVADLATFSWTFVSQSWQAFHIKDGTKGPVVWEVKTAPIYLKDSEGLPTQAHWLIVARNALDHDEIKYFVSNAEPEAALKLLLHVAFSRWHVERCFEDEKTELGMDHFEVRTYCALMRHLALTAVSHLFVARAHQRLKKNSGPDGVPSPHGGECVFGREGETRPQPATVLGTGIAGDHQDATEQCQSNAQSSQENAQASAASRSLCVTAATL
jgi:SRSO17 transposase